MDFYKYLNYSLGNEDWRVEEQALRVTPGDRVVCVTASGDRSLHLLMTECAEVMSIDMNRAQTHLLELKIAALKFLDYETYLAFLGCKPTRHRYSIFRQLKAHLSLEAAYFWEQHKKLIHRGVIYQGRIEKLTYFTGIFFNLLGRKKINTMLSFDHIQEQREYVAKKWDSFFFRKLFETVINPKILKFVINDPGFTSYTEYTNVPGRYIYQRMLDYLDNNLARDSVLFQLLFTGKVSPQAYFPYLTFDGYSKIRGNLSRLTYQTTNIVELLNQEEMGPIDCFSMSDIASYMPQQIFERLLHGLHASAKHGSRFCMREFMSKRFIPDYLKPHFQRNSKLEKKLEHEETNFVYRFMVGEIQK